MVTVLIIIVVGCLLVFGFKTIVPFLWDVLRMIYNVVTFPLALLGGFLGFLIEAGIFIGLLWLAVKIIGG